MKNNLSLEEKAKRRRKSKKLIEENFAKSGIVVKKVKKDSGYCSYGRFKK